MSFSFTEQTYIEMVWFVSYDGGDWLATLYKDDAESPWRLTSRFRYQVDRKIYDSEDIKDWSESRATDGSPATAATVIAGVDAMSDRMARTLTGQRHRIPIQGDLDAFTRIMAEQPFSHLTRIPVPPTSHRPQ